MRQAPRLKRRASSAAEGLSLERREAGPTKRAHLMSFSAATQWRPHEGGAALQSPLQTPQADPECIDPAARSGRAGSCGRTPRSARAGGPPSRCLRRTTAYLPAVKTGSQGLWLSRQTSSRRVRSPGRRRAVTVSTLRHASRVAKWFGDLEAEGLPCERDGANAVALRGHLDPCDRCARSSCQGG